MEHAEYLGSFPAVGPVTYLTDEPAGCRRLMKGPFPSVRTWFHGTSERVARLACVQGIAPGRWLGTGGERCAVLGYDSLDEFLERRGHLWIVEICGPALAGDLKAWWVPCSSVRGVWRLESFYPRAAIATSCSEPLTFPRSGCACALADICLEQQTLWRRTWSNFG
jgi:hypothetical protein